MCARDIIDLLFYFFYMLTYIRVAHALPLIKKSSQDQKSILSGGAECRIVFSTAHTFSNSLPIATQIRGSHTWQALFPPPRYGARLPVLSREASRYRRPSSSRVPYVEGSNVFCFVFLSGLVSSASLVFFPLRKHAQFFG